jgi:hypothetical protein
MGLHGDPPQAQIWYIAQAAITRLILQKKSLVILMENVQTVAKVGQDQKKEVQILELRLQNLFLVVRSSILKEHLVT